MEHTVMGNVIFGTALWSDAILLGQLNPKSVSWMTPLWLIGVGALAGLLILAFLWAVCWGLSRIPALGNLLENRSRFRFLSLLLGGVLGVLALAYGGYQVYGQFQTGVQDEAYDSLIRLVVFALPILIGCWAAVAMALSLVSKRTVSEVGDAVNEGFLFYVLIVTCVMAVLGVLGFVVLRPVGDSLALVGTLARTPYVGTTPYQFTIPASEDPEVLAGRKSPEPTEIAVGFRGPELQSITFYSTQDLSLARSPDISMDTPESIEIRAEESVPWQRRRQGGDPFGDEEITSLYVRNRGAAPAELKVEVTTTLQYPQTRIIPAVALAVVFTFASYIALRALMPRMMAIALATFKSEVAQPIFLAVLIFTVLFLWLSIYIPYHTFGEDIKMLKDSGLTVIKVMGLVLAVWGASTTVADEIEGRTALTVLSKPIGRRSFIIGKFLGISGTVALLYMLLGVLLLAVVSYKGIYDARENSQDIPVWQMCFLEMVGTLPGLALGFMETLVLTALSVAISTRLPMIANFVICFALFGLGHLTPLIVQVTDNRFAIVRFFGQLTAVVVPNLESFDVKSAIDAGLAVPMAYLGYALLYCATFCLIALFLALLLFEDRDVA